MKRKTKKRCSSCREPKARALFAKNKRMADGLQNNCNDCRKTFRDSGEWPTPRRTCAECLNLKPVSAFGLRGRQDYANVCLPCSTGRGLKWCPACTRDRRTEEFSKNSASPDGLDSFCAECSNSRRRLKAKKAGGPGHVSYRTPEQLSRQEAKDRISIRGVLSRRISEARQRAECSVTVDFLMRMYSDLDGRCSVSGIPMRVGAAKRAFDSMSVDRIDSSKGYTEENTRLVIWAVNAGMGDWGEDVFALVCQEVIKRRTEHMDGDAQ